MPYIGRAATNTGSVRYLDNIASGFDGSDTTFTAQVGGVNITPDQENVEIYLDGVFQHPGSGNAYTISGSTITFTEAPVANTVFTGYVVGAGAYLDDKAVSSAKLDDDAVTAAKLDDDGTGFQVGDLGVGGSLTSGDKLTVTGRARVSGGIIGDLTGDVTGDVTGNVTGNTSGTAATVTGAAQSAITSVGTLSSLTLGGDLTLPQKIVHSGDTDTYLSFGTDSLSLYTGGTNVVDFIYGNIYIKGNNKALTGYTTGGGAKELIKIDSSDVVQIGEGQDVSITGDGARLFVKSADEELISIGRAGSSGASLDQGYIRMKNAGTNTIALHSASNSYLTNGLSIGTSSMNSNATVHIRGGDSGQSSSSNNTQLTVESSGTAGIQLLTGTTNVGGFWIGDSNGAETGGKLYYSNNDDSWSFYNSGSNNTLNIKSAGLLGINCSPANGYPLDILATSGNANVRVSATGSGQGARLFLRSHNTDSTYLSFNDSDDDTVLAQIRSYGTAHGTTAKRRGMALETAGAERIFIDSSGNLKMTSAGSFEQRSHNYTNADTDGRCIRIVRQETGDFDGDITIYITTDNWKSCIYDIKTAGYEGSGHYSGGFYVNNGVHNHHAFENNYDGNVGSLSVIQYDSSNYPHRIKINIPLSSDYTHPIIIAEFTIGGAGVASIGDISMDIT